MLLLSSLVLLASPAALVSCGGGGGGDSAGYNVMSVDEMRSASHYYFVNGGIVRMQISPESQRNYTEPSPGLPQGEVEMVGEFQAGTSSSTYEVIITYVVTEVDAETDEPLRAMLSYQFTDLDVDDLRHDRNTLTALGIPWALDNDGDGYIYFPISSKMVFTPAAAVIEYEYEGAVGATIPEGFKRIVCSYGNLPKK